MVNSIPTLRTGRKRVEAGEEKQNDPQNARKAKRKSKSGATCNTAVKKSAEREKDRNPNVSEGNFLVSV